jgi:hypothetical protein
MALPHGIAMLSVRDKLHACSVDIRQCVHVVVGRVRICGESEREFGHGIVVYVVCAMCVWLDDFGTPNELLTTPSERFTTPS